MSGTVVLLLALFVVLVAPSSYWEEIRSIAEENTPANPYGTGAARHYTWKVAWGMFLDNPIIGVGQGNFPWNVGAYELKLGFTEGFHQRSMAGRAAHSLYFTLMPELGLIGIALFASMVVMTVRDLRFIQRSAGSGSAAAGDALPFASLATALEASLVGYLFSGIFISVLYYPNFWLLMGFALSLRRILERRQGVTERSGLPGSGRRKFSVSGGRTGDAR